MADDLTRPASDLYERDYVAWTEAQASALRSRKGGENALDYDNLAEEIEDLGKSEQRACESQIENIIEHLLKIEFVGPAETIPHWSKELRGFRRELSKRRTATIDNRLQLELAGAFDYAVKSLVTGGLLPTADEGFEGSPGYSWDQIIDPDWYPVPRYAS
ncbi:DUF29 domain-containing protein [Brevundimonas sp. TWP2-3-4b1]|uniref:DUF29 domain-containing protein n=1 Tax=Brevundimonas sp. TWP2-3-4b1 TaxID=2804580 RepID=UPI003CE7853B